MYPRREICVTLEVATGVGGKSKGERAGNFSGKDDRGRLEGSGFERSKIQFRAKWAGPGELKGGRRKRVGYSRVNRGSKRCREGEEL
jgi:hypothetical protein